MAEREIYEWSAVAAGNQFAPADGGWVEQMSRDAVNDAARVDMAALRRFYNDSEWIRPRIQGPLPGNAGVFARTGSNTCTITLPGVDLRPYFGALRIVKIINGGGLGVDLVTQCSIAATYGAGVTTITTKAPIHTASTDIYAHSDSILRAQALLDDNSQFYIPATADAAGILAACTAASAAGGGTVFLDQSVYSIATQIDLTGTLGNITILGRASGTKLQRVAAIGSILNFSNVIKRLELRNINFDVDWLTNPTGNGYGLSIANCLAVSIENCEFVRCETGIKITGSNCHRISVRNSYFTYHRYGVASSNLSDTHEGTIEGCTFDGSVASLSTPAAMKLAGSWIVRGNNLRAMSHATLVPVGVWIWDKTAPANGGYRCVVANNVIHGPLATGVLIWMGGDDGVCVGNMLYGGSGVTGIRIGSFAAGAPTERVVVSDNSIEGGNIGIQMTEFARHGTVRGNSIVPSSGTSMILGGDLNQIAENFMRSAPIGIELLGTASQNLVLGNLIADLTSDGIIVRANASSNAIRMNYITGTPARGINVEASAVSNFVGDNFAPGIALPVTNASTSTLIARNRESDFYFESVQTSLGASGTENDFETGVDLPREGGIGKYLAEFYVDGGSASYIRCRVGPLGTIADPIAATFTSSSGTIVETGLLTQLTFVVTGATDKLTLTRQTTGGGGTTLNKVIVRITKISEPLG